jgi:pimeloyl-ACP methyl ester carboxylesterase
VAANALVARAVAQARVPLALAAAHDGRVVGGAARALSGTPSVEESPVGGVGSEIFRPGRGAGPWPAVVVLPGVTRQGREHPALRAVARGLAGSGHIAILAEPEGLAVGELGSDALEQTRAAVAAAASRPDAAHGRVAVVGVSGGATLGLLAAAADAELAERISMVVALAPCCDIVEAIRVVTTGAYRDGDVLVPFATRDFFKLVTARSVVAGLPPGPDRSSLRAHLLALEDYGPEPLEGVRVLSRAGLEPAARAVVGLLANVDPARFDELLAALPEEFVAHLDSLSPVSAAARIVAPVELVVGRSDKYFPPADAAAFARACPQARLTVLDSLEHAVPSFSPAAARDLLRLDGVLVRLLAAARGTQSYSRR